MIAERALHATPLAHSTLVHEFSVLPGAILAHKAEAFRDLTRSCHAESGNPAGCRPRNAGGMSVTAILNPTRASSHARRDPNLAQQFESDAGPTKARPGQAV